MIRWKFTKMEDYWDSYIRYNDSPWLAYLATGNRNTSNKVVDRGRSLGVLERNILIERLLDIHQHKCYLEGKIGLKAAKELLGLPK